MLAASFTIFIQSCSDDEEGLITTVLEIGNYYQGGVIFYIDDTGEHGFICAVSDQSFNAEWGCPDLINFGADGLTIGTGAQNTADIISACNTSGIAADICDKLELNGYTDWFLASKDELNLLYQNRNAINETAISNGGANLDGGEYWSSSHKDANTVWIQSFNAGNQFSVLKDEAHVVRAIRAF